MVGCFACYEVEWRHHALRLLDGLGRLSRVKNLDLVQPQATPPFLSIP